MIPPLKNQLRSGREYYFCNLRLGKKILSQGSTARLLEFPVLLMPGNDAERLHVKEKFLNRMTHLFTHYVI
jgi:hypothetical protein